MTTQVCTNWLLMKVKAELGYLHFDKIAPPFSPRNLPPNRHLIGYAPNDSSTKRYPDYANLCVEKEKTC